IFYASTWSATTGGNPLGGANASGTPAAIHQEWFPPLDHCTATPGCIGHHEAIYNALDDLIVRLSDPTLAGLAQTNIFDKLGNDANGNKLTTQSFIRYLTSKRPGFYDGLRSSYCYSVLDGTLSEFFCYKNALAHR